MDQYEQVYCKSENPRNPQRKNIPIGGLFVDTCRHLITGCLHSICRGLRLTRLSSCFIPVEIFQPVIYIASVEFVLGKATKFVYIYLRLHGIASEANVSLLDWESRESPDKARSLERGSLRSENLENV